MRDLDGSGAISADYLDGPAVDNKLRKTAGGSISYFISDNLGSTRALTDASGTVVEQIEYDSFGNSIGSAITRYTYTGREQDSVTGQFYYRARFYDPQVGRFVSEDPIGFGGGINWYAYVQNDPIGSDDPFGLWGLPRSRTRTRPCRPPEMEQCKKICGPRGVQSCMISQTFRIVRIKDILSGWRWVDGPMSCSCNECDEDKAPVPIPIILPKPTTNPGPTTVPVPVWLPRFFTIPIIMMDPCLVYPELCYANRT